MAGNDIRNEAAAHHGSFRCNSGPWPVMALSSVWNITRRKVQISRREAPKFHDDEIRGKSMTLQFRPMLAVFLCAILGLSGCATITRGSTEAWTVETSPIGATVSLSNGERCETPCTLKLKRKHPIAVEVCKGGYDVVSTVVQSEISGAGGTAMAGNVLFGGLIGAGVDAGTGAMKDLRPNPLKMELVAAEPGCVAPSFPAVPENGQTPAEYADWKD